MRREKRESRELREALGSGWLMGDLAEISCWEAVLGDVQIVKYHFILMGTQGRYGLSHKGAPVGVERFAGDGKGLILID